MTTAPFLPTYPLTANNPSETSRALGEYVSLVAPFYVDEWTNPAAASANAIKTSVASSGSAQTYSGAALNGSIGAGAISPPRNITVTTGGGTATQAPATVTVTGTDIDGNTMTETISGVNGGAATYSGSKCFASVTSLALAAGGGTSATMTFGTGTSIGLTKQAKTRAGSVNVAAEISGGSVVTNGTFTKAATAAPNGSYTPNSAPNGSTSYAVTYELATQ